jgi:squalene-hopene/tetraprenyl-beta-curcumene cyclase
MLESDYIFMHTLLGTGDRGKMERAVNEILRHQNADGGWSIYPNGPSNISLGVKAYFALKLMGWSPDHPVLVKAREWILANGGVTECNTFTKIYLCFLGQYEYDAVPAVPPEIVLFPNWFYFNIYEISAWSRAILVPLSIAYAKKPFKKIPPEQGIDELFVGGRKNADLHLKWDRKNPIGWRNFFPADWTASPTGGAGTHPAAAQDGAEEGGEVAAGALRDVRRAGRDLSGDAECDHRAALPGLLGRRPAVHPRDGRV